MTLLSHNGNQTLIKPKIEYWKIRSIPTVLICRLVSPQAPLSGSNSMTLCCLWCVSGPIAMTVSVEKKAFIPGTVSTCSINPPDSLNTFAERKPIPNTVFLLPPGEAVKVICDFSNASSRTATPKVVLQQKQTCYDNKLNKNAVVKNLARVSGRPVGAHTSYVHAELALPIPTLASLTISNCSIIDVDYVIEVGASDRLRKMLKRKGSHCFPFSLFQLFREFSICYF